MRIFRSFEEASVITSPVVTTGTFDGVHAGHKTIIRRLKKLADDYKGESTLITFHPHPRMVLHPETAGRGLKLIFSQDEKIEMLRKAGVDNVIIIEFTKEFSHITGEEFVRDILCGILKAKSLWWGITTISASTSRAITEHCGTGEKNMVLRRRRFPCRRCRMRR